MPGVKYFELGFHAGILDQFGHAPQMSGRIHEYSLTEIHRAHVQRADIGAQFEDVAHAHVGRIERRAFTGDARIVVARHEAAALAGRQVDQHVAAGVANTLDDLAKMGRVGRTRAGLGVAHMDMGDRGASLARLDARLGDLFGRDRKIGMLVKIHVAAGHRASDDRLSGHVPSPAS